MTRPWGVLITLITGLLIGCSAGSNVVIAKYIGMGDRERAEKATGASVLFSLVGGAQPSVQKALIDLLSTALGISANRVSVVGK